MGRASREVWADRVARWRAGKLTAAEFAERHGISAQSLKWWSWKLGSKAGRRAGSRRPKAHRAATTAAAVAPLTFVEMTSALRRQPIEVVLLSGVRLLVPHDVERAALECVVDALEHRR